MRPSLRERGTGAALVSSGARRFGRGSVGAVLFGCEDEEEEASSVAQRQRGREGGRDRKGIQEERAERRGAGGREGGRQEGERGMEEQLLS